jgi:chitodextrinase
MSLKLRVFVSAVVCACLVLMLGLSGHRASAQTNDNASLLLQIQNLQQLVAQLEAKLAAQSGQVLGVGSRVQTTANLKVRSQSSTSGKILCIQHVGTQGTIVAGPAGGSGYVWWSVKFDSSCSGWVVQNYLAAVSTDTTSPSTPTGLTATPISSSQINLAWTASTDNVGVAGYKIYRGEQQIGTSTTNSYQNTGLNASTNYSYAVAAFDAAGNTSAQSVSVSATTQSGGTTGGVGVTPTPPPSPSPAPTPSPSPSPTPTPTPPPVTGSLMTPLCGAVDDHLTHIPSNWSSQTAPGEGNSYVDGLATTINSSAIGCTIHQISDATKDLPEGGGKFAPTAMFYSVEQSNFNVNDGYLLLYQSGSPGAVSHWYIKNITNLANPSIQIDPAHMPSDIYSSSEPIWDATNANLFYYTNNGAVLKSATITGVNTLTTSVVKDFSATYSSVTIMNYGQKNYGGTIIGLVGRQIGSGSQPLVEFTFDLSTLTVVKSQVTPCSAAAGGLGAQPGGNCLHKFQITPNGNMVMDFVNVSPAATYQGISISSGSGLVQVWDNNKAAHHTTGLANDGTTEMYVSVDDPNGARSQNPCNQNLGKVWMSIGDILAASSPPATEHCLFSDGFLQDGHISWGGGPNQPWIAMSEADAGGLTRGAFYFNNNPSYIAPSASCAYGATSCINTSAGAWTYGNGELILVPSDCVGSTSGAGCTAGASGRVAYRMAWINDRGNQNFYNSPEVNCSRDGMYCAINESLAYNAAGCPASVDQAQGQSCDDTYVIGPLFAAGGTTPPPAPSPSPTPTPTPPPAPSPTPSPTPPPSDTTAPSIPTGLTAMAISSSQINLSWTASTDNVGVTGYKIYRNGSQVATTAGTSYQDTGLTASTSYTYAVAAYDAAGNTSAKSGTVNATTQSGGTADTTPPSTPTGLTATAISSSQINLSWTASTDNVDVTGYRIYRGGVQIATSVGTSYSNTGLTPSTSYTYAVAAYDAAGNHSSPSASASATTTP